MTTDPGSEARCSVLRALHKLQGAGTAEAIRMTTKLPPSQLQEALLSLEADGWIRRDYAARFAVYRLTPETRRARLVVMEE